MKFIKQITTLIAGTILSFQAQALQDDALVPILLYHSWAVSPPCDYPNNNLLALEQDLEMLKANGWTVVPLSYLVEWRLGIRNGNTMPDKVVAITMDDGHNLDWVDGAFADQTCAPLQSFGTTLKKFKQKYAGQIPSYSPHATTFVIGSPVARDQIGWPDMDDSWWFDAQWSNVMDVENHSTDHDHDTIISAMYDPDLNTTIPSSGYSTGVWAGSHNPGNITTLGGANAFVVPSAKYIQSKTGKYPAIFAHPYGIASNYMLNSYFSQLHYWTLHKTEAAMCTERVGQGALLGNYMTKTSHRYCIPRFTFQSSWTTPEGLLEILEFAENN